MPRLHPSTYVEAASHRPGARLCCAVCGALATWDYLPAPASARRSYCDQHVPRGCSCSEGSVDASGRRRPCIEYDYEADGFLRRPAA